MNKEDFLKHGESLKVNGLKLYNQMFLKPGDPSRMKCNRINARVKGAGTICSIDTVEFTIAKERHAMVLINKEAVSYLDAEEREKRIFRALRKLEEALKDLGVLKN